MIALAADSFWKKWEESLRATEFKTFDGQPVLVDFEGEFWVYDSGIWIKPDHINLNIDWQKDGF